ncbi:MAG: hypothetical protein LQ339_008466 [Xanthoria mediterranea]|nr:MAG: hypothetical protein LQ339_008466 [Xanthoria mediterranea]
MAVLNSSTLAKGNGVPRIDSAIALVNLPQTEVNGVHDQDTPATSSAPVSDPLKPDSQQRKDVRLHNLQRKLTDFASRLEDADLSVRRMMSQNSNASPHALILVEAALDQAILATSTLMNKALQGALDSMTTSSETSILDQPLSMQDIPPKSDPTTGGTKTAPTKVEAQAPQLTAPTDEAKHRSLTKIHSRVPKPSASSTTSPAVRHFLELQQGKPPHALLPRPNTLAALWHKSLMPPPDSYKGHLRNLQQRLARRSATRTGLDLPHAPNGGLIPHSRYCYEYYDPYDWFQCEVDDQWIKVELLECVRWIGNLVMDFQAEKKGKGTKVVWVGSKDQWMFLEVMGKEGVLERMVGEVE